MSVFTFWDMTLKEINTFIKAIQEKEKKNRTQTYLLASLTANFVGCVMNGKQIPPIHQVFPEVYQELAEEERKAQEYRAMMLYKEQMIDYAMAVNKRNKVTRDGENK